MNRSILIVICDFLLVSLLAFSSFDNLTEERPERKPEPRRKTRHGRCAQIGSLRGEAKPRKVRLGIGEGSGNRADTASVAFRTRYRRPASAGKPAENRNSGPRIRTAARFTSTADGHCPDQRAVAPERPFVHAVRSATLA